MYIIILIVQYISVFAEFTNTTSHKHAWNAHQYFPSLGSQHMEDLGGPYYEAETQVWLQESCCHPFQWRHRLSH